MTIAKLGICDRCHQYDEDCACCAHCDGTGYRHDHGCKDATTAVYVRRSGVVAAHKPTLRGMQAPLTLRTPVFSFRVDGSTGHESTGEVRVVE